MKRSATRGKAGPHTAYEAAERVTEWTAVSPFCHPLRGFNWWGKFKPPVSLRPLRELRFTRGYILATRFAGSKKGNFKIRASAK